MPAEWALHDRCWMAWPCRPDSWPEGIESARQAFAQVALAISRFEPVAMLAHPSDVSEARRLTQGVVDLVPIDLDDSWARDIAPTFVHNASGGLVGVDWGFNGWGLVYRGFARDARVARRILGWAGVPRLVGPQILEGGSIHVDGDGTLLTTEECLLDPERNPHLTKADIEVNLRSFLGAEAVVWLPCGLTNDETRGHVDNLACFSRPGHVLLPATAPGDPDFEVLEQACAVLEGSADARGRPLVVTRLPCPPRREDAAGRVMPLSYVNFYLANGGLIMPGFDETTDAAAAAVLSTAFPGREIVVVPGHVIATGGGNIHCITMQQPAGARML